jgi:hypothetical protein
MFSDLVRKPQPSSRLDSVLFAPIRYVDEATGAVQVSLAHTGGKSLSAPLWRLTGANGLTLPAYRVGDTLAFSYLNGNPNTGVQLGIVQNAINPPAQTDRLTYKLEDSLVEITNESITLTVGQSQLILKDGSVELKAITSFKVNGKEVATVGAKDSDGDTVTSKGW